MVARIFQMDPVVVLTEKDPYRRAARIAATQHVVEVENAANKKK